MAYINGSYWQNRYEARIYQRLCRQGMGKKFEHPGVYCIKVDDRIVYIGRSTNMLKRIASHYYGLEKGAETKYRILAEAQRKHLCIEFDVLYLARSKYQALYEEIGQKEGELIRAYMPELNTQIPHENNWRTWDVRKIDVQKTRKLLGLDD